MTKIKFCGIRTMEDVWYCNEVLPEYVGFVFAPSKRQVTMKEAIWMRKKLNESIKTVGVFVNASTEEICRYINSGCIQLVQLHGDETKEAIQSIREKSDVPIIQVVRIGQERIQNEPLECFGQYILFDTYEKGVYGGTGKSFYTSQLPENIDVPMFVAGGIGVHNVKQIIEKVAPYGVDISSGIETDGKKNLEKMKQISDIIRKEKGRMTNETR